MRTAVRAGLLLSGSALASMVASNWSHAQTELPEVKVTAPKETPKPAPKKTAARKPAPRTVAAPRQVATPAPPPPSPEQVAAQAAENVMRQNQVLDQKITNNITPPLGATTYVITQQAIENQPGGTNTPLDKVLLQAPGVTQDADVQGGIHIRNEHANIAYRFNGILLPEGVQGFGQVLESNFIGSMALLTGVLPAQYGLRTAGVLDITTRIPNTPGSGSISMYGGSHETATPSFEYGGVVG
ncbi:MAG: Plug domain-containing protein, partial [Xanthobacteraceae bacterium]